MNEIKSIKTEEKKCVISKQKRGMYVCTFS